MNNENRSANVDNSQFINAHSVTASGNAHIGPTVNQDGGGQESLDELRTLVNRLTEQLRSRTEPGPDAEEARWRAEELAEVLQEQQPNPERVRSRWSRLQPLAQPLAAAGALAEITGLVQTLF